MKRKARRPFECPAGTGGKVGGVWWLRRSGPKSLARLALIEIAYRLDHLGSGCVGSSPRPPEGVPGRSLDGQEAKQEVFGADVGMSHSASLGDGGVDNAFRAGTEAFHARTIEPRAHRV